MSPSRNGNKLSAVCRKIGLAVFAVWLLTCVIWLSQSWGVSAQSDVQISPSAAAQVAEVLKIKQSKTAAQKKINANLFIAMLRQQGRLSPLLSSLRTRVETGADGRPAVDITVRNQTAGLTRVNALRNVTVIRATGRFIHAYVPFDQLEKLAEESEVISIQPPPQAITNSNPAAERPAARAVDVPAVNTARPAFEQRAARLREQLRGSLTKLGARVPATALAGTVNSQGDTTHRAATARTMFGIDGTGIKIGVLSDTFNALGGANNDVLTGNLPGPGNPDGRLTPVTVLQDLGSGTDEGRAMLQIVHDLAPGAELYFATAFGGVASFANNIRALRTAGCQIIVDDVFYFVESPLHDGQPAISTSPLALITQAVNDVTADGALYFSSAGNSGNKNDGTSGTWEGDFKANGSLGNLPGGMVHDFGGGANANPVPTTGGSFYTLHWADPLGASGNDYDIFIFDSSLTILFDSGTNTQDGDDEPFEITAGGAFAGDRVVIFQHTGAADRFLSLRTNRGRLSISTSGVTGGHSAAANAFSVAATPTGPASAGVPGPFPSPFNATNRSENFSSDGPRQLFYKADGTLFGTGLLAGQGLTRQKPDITAADGVSTTLSGGLNPFFGTSAAAPHAAAIAALLLDSNPALTPTQVRTALNISAIDIEAPGIDRDTGTGIVMAVEAMQALSNLNTAVPILGVVTVTDSPFVNGIITAGESGALTIQLQNLGLGTATNVVGTLSTTTPGITIQSPATRLFPDIPGNGSASLSQPYIFMVAPTACGVVINFTLTLTFDGGAAGASPKVLTFTVPTESFATTLTTVLNATAPAPVAGVTTATGTQTGRLLRNGIASSCAAPKGNPGLNDATVVRRYDAYTFTVGGSGTQCITVTLNQPTTTLFMLAYNSNGFIPATPAVNYLADPGASAATTSFSFNALGGTAVTVVVHEVNANGGLNTTYTLTINGANLTCNPVIPPAANLTLSKSADSPAVQAGDNLTYTVNLNNGGPAAASNVAVLDTVPAGTTFVSAAVTSGTGWTPFTPPVGGTGDVTFVKSSVANGESAAFSIIVQTSPLLPLGASITNTASVSTSSTNTGNSSATVTTPIACPPLTLAPSLPGGVQGTAYNQSVVAAGGAGYSYAVTTNILPPGLTLNAATGALTGSPSASGNYAFVVTATGLNGCGKVQSYNLLITGTCATITVNPTTLPNGTLGTAYPLTTVSATGGVAPYTFAVTLGALPAGLALNGTTGEITGTPTAAGTFSFRVTATGQGGCTGSRVYIVSVACATLTFNPASLPNGAKGVAYNQAITVTPGTGHTFSVLLGSLPPGFTLSAAGVLSGLTNQAGTWTFTVKAVLGSCQATKQYTLTIPNTMAPTALAQLNDYDGDGKGDLALFAANGEWRIQRSSDQKSQTVRWGTAGDLPVSGDYDGDGKTDIAVFRPSNGTWYILPSGRSSDGAALVKAWGLSTDVPVPGDYDGDGKTDLAVWRGGEGNWYILRSSDQQFEMANWGLSLSPFNDVPVAGDYDGDGKTDVGVFRRANGVWYVRQSGNGNFLIKQWGVGSDVPVVQDYDGDGKVDLAVWRGATGLWYIQTSATGAARATAWGAGFAPYNDQAVPGDYDGDGQADLAVWRAADATWYLSLSGVSQNSATRVVRLGEVGDRPVAANRW